MSKIAERLTKQFATLAKKMQWGMRAPIYGFLFSFDEVVRFSGDATSLFPTNRHDGLGHDRAYGHLLREGTGLSVKDMEGLSEAIDAWLKSPIYIPTTHRNGEEARHYAYGENRLDAFEYMVSQQDWGVLTVPVDGFQFFHQYWSPAPCPVSVVAAFGDNPPYPDAWRDWYDCEHFGDRDRRDRMYRTLNGSLGYGILGGIATDELVNHVVAAAVKWMSMKAPHYVNGGIDDKFTHPKKYAIRR